MSSHSHDLPSVGAEAAFRAAFERLKNGTTERLPKGSRVSQNNVAREAGNDPTALRKSRFPSLIHEIQLWVSANNAEGQKSRRQKILLGRERNRTLREKLTELKMQRDCVTSLLLEADAKILELTMENQRMEALLKTNSISPFSKPNREKH